MSLKYALFDLDGTLTDPGLGITNCVQYALNHFGITPATREELYPYIGPPLLYSFREFHGLSEEEAEQAVVLYRERFSRLGMFENEVFGGVPELMEWLISQGVSPIVATSKPEEYTIEILKHFDLLKYFVFVGGNTLKEERPNKSDVIGYIMQYYPDISPENSVMIGDRKYDIEGAHAFSLPAIGVLYGYGDCEEMVAAGAEWIANDIFELREVLKTMIH